MSPNLRQLKAFLAIARLGSFRRAADQLHLSQPALTVQIRELEAAVGVKLLDRNTRSVTVTQTGRRIAPTLERLLAELEAVLHDTREVAARKRGLVTVAALPSISARKLPAVIARFRQKFPGISVRLRDCVAVRVLDLVKAGEVDFGISSLPRPDPDIDVTPLVDDHMVAVFPARHPLEKRRHLTLKDLQAYPLILMESGSSVRALLDRAFEDQGLPLTAAHDAAYISTAIGMVKAGLGVTLLPSSATEFEGARGLRARPVAQDGLKRSIGLLQRRGRTLSPAAQAFIETLQASLR